jgi:hypothetical protein
MTKLKAIETLYNGDHQFFSPEVATQIINAFGLKLKLQRQQDTRSQFKGLTLFGKNPETGKEYREGDWSEGYDSADLASTICTELNIEFESYYGRGSQLAHCAEQLKKKFK